MRAMLLTAGVGQRMRPLTLSLPKPAIPVLGRPMVIHALAHLGRAGLDEIVMNLHHLPEVLRETVYRLGPVGLPAVRFTEEPTILGTAGGIGHAAPLLRGDPPILISNSDFLSDIDLLAVAGHHVASGLAATLVLVPARKGYSEVEVDGAGRILSLAGAPEVDPERVAGAYTFTGFHVIDEEVLDLIPAGRPSHIVQDVYRDLAADGRLGYRVHDGFWWEFGSPESYLEGSLRLLDLPADARRRVLDHDPDVTANGARVLVRGPGARVHSSARFAKRAAVGMASRVGERTHIEDSVIMPEAWIGPGCRLKRTVVALGVEVPSGFEAENALVCADPGGEAELPPGVRREAGLLVYDFATNGAGSE